MTEPPSASPPPSLGRLVDALSSRADVASLSRVLTGALADALPPEMVQVDYRRGVADRLAGREGTPIAITVRTTDKVLTLEAAPGAAPRATIAHSVRGVVLSRTPVGITEWITALATELTQLGAADEAASSALQRLLLG